MTNDQTRTQSTMPSTWVDVCRYYDHLTLHIVAGPRSWSYFLPFALTFSALLLPPSILSHRLNRWLVLPVICAIQISIWIQHDSFDVISVDTVLTAFMLLGWYDVRHDFKYVRWNKPGGIPVRDQGNSMRSQGDDISGNSSKPDEADLQSLVIFERYPESMLNRIRWVGTLSVSMRFTGWHIGVRSHDARQPGSVKPFGDFIRETALHGIFCCVLFDFTSTCMALLPRWIDVSSAPSKSLFVHGVASLIHLAHFYAALALLNALVPHLISIISLLLVPSLRYNSMLSPLTWPSHFGPLSSIYTRKPETPTQNLGLRAFWGIFWHQNMRYITSTPGVALSSAFGLAPGSRSRHMVIVTSGFFWSGVIHMGVVPPRPVGTILTAWEMRFRVAAFFWLQIVGIGLEDLLQSALEMYAQRRMSLVPEQGALRARNPDQLQSIEDVSVTKKVLIFLWTVAFLASTAWWTVYPVGCEMNWWKLKILPTFLSSRLVGVEW